MTSLARTLRVLRERDRLTSAEVAKRVRVTPQRLARYEHGTARPTWDELNRFARAYHVPAAGLRALPDEPSAPHRIDRRLHADPRGVCHPSDGLMGEWLILAGAWRLFGADACAAMLDGEPGYACRAVEYMGVIRLTVSAPWGAHILPVPGIVRGGEWDPPAR